MDFSLKNIGLTILCIYSMICGWLYFYQDNILFNPYRLPSDYTFESEQTFQLKVAKNVSLNCLWIRDATPKGVILYLHGNKRSINRSLPEAMNMTQLGHDILMVDYRGFGKSGGKIESEVQLYRDIQKVYDYLQQDYAEHQIIIVGFSLGAVMASYLAKQNHPSALVLVAPFKDSYALKNYHFSILIPNFLVKYPLDNAKHLQKVTCQTLILHGKRDEVVPFTHAVTLADINRKNFQLELLEQETHRSIMQSAEFREKIQYFLQ